MDKPATISQVYTGLWLNTKAGSPRSGSKRGIMKSAPGRGHGSRTIQLNNLGELYFAMGKYKESGIIFLQARQMWEKKLGKEHPYYIANSDELARVYWNTNETEKANELFTEVSAAKYSQLNKIFQFTNESEKELYLKI